MTSLNYSMEHSVGRQVQEKYQGIPQKLDLYILQSGRHWISLYPFISIFDCPCWETSETYFVDAWQGSNKVANLRSFQRGHEEASQEIGHELTGWLA